MSKEYPNLWEKLSDEDRTTFDKAAVDYSHSAGVTKEAMQTKTFVIELTINEATDIWLHLSKIDSHNLSTLYKIFNTK